MTTEPTASSQSLVLRAPDAARVADDVRLQKLWLATQKRPWRSLAVVGASLSVDTAQLAQLFAQLAWSYRGQPSCVFDLRDLSLRLVEYHQREVQAQVDSGACVIIALRSPMENPTATPMARSADAIVLCIELGKTHFRDAEQALEEVGRERVIGVIVVNSARPKKKPPQQAPGRA